MRRVVLLVDDCSVLRSSVDEYLTSFGFHAISTGELRHAQRILDKKLVDVVVTDVVLGRETALPIIRKAAALNVRTIVTSAFVEESVYRLLGNLAQSVSILKKPFDLSRLRRQASVDTALPRMYPTAGALTPTGSFYNSPA